jgi:DNA gyrase subunit A
MPETRSPESPSGAIPPTPPDEPVAASSGGEGAERIVDLDIERELQDSYLTYAMSTIMDRALPDVRDGLKPSQRRILVAMNDLNLRPNKKPLKCAKIAGDTSGNYHPHGESVIYPTLVGLAQPWRMRVPLIHPQGNFGSIEGDPPAAMRYTEARMTQAAVDMLADLKLDTVDFQPNYDDRLTEPLVLPGKFPNLLINGSMGIAVGMATSLPPHNPVEVLDSIIRVIEDPDLDLAQLMTDVLDEDGNIIRRAIQGPDFPTGGVIHGKRGILDAYLTGRGKATVRGVCRIEDGPTAGREQIIIQEIPYNLAQNGLVERIVEAVKDERIKDIADVRNESGREARTRIVVELKRGADPNVVENQLYQFTPLQQTFSMMTIALVNRQPRTLTLKQLIELYIEHRVEVVRRRSAYLLREARKKAHVLEGLIYAVCDIDEVIKLIRSSSTRDEAIGKLMARRFRIASDHEHASKIPQRLLDFVDAQPNGVALTRVQAEQIGSMRLIQLVGLEIERIVNDYTALVEEIEGYEAILADHKLVLDIIREDCEEMRARYASHRLTRIEEAEGDIDIEALIQVEDMAVTISHAGYVKRVPISTYRAQGRGGKGIRASENKEDDFVEHLFVASTHDDLLCFTDTGRVFRKKVYELPAMSRTSKGRAIVNLLDLKEGERTQTFLTINDFESGSHYLTFVTRGGIVKRTALKQYQNITRAGIIAVGLRDDDELYTVALTSGTDDLLIVTSKGQAIRFNEEQVRLMGRSAAGVKGIELAQGDQVVGMVRIPTVTDDDGDNVTENPDLCLLTITQNGYGKRTPVDEYLVQPEGAKPRAQSRGGKGRADIKTTPRNGPSVSALGVLESDDVVVITRGGLLVRTPAGSISRFGRGTQGVRVVTLNDGDEVIAAARVDDDQADAEDAAELTAPDAGE